MTFEGFYEIIFLNDANLSLILVTLASAHMLFMQGVETLLKFKNLNLIYFIKKFNLLNN